MKEIYLLTIMSRGRPLIYDDLWTALVLNLLVSEELDLIDIRPLGRGRIGYVKSDRCLSARHLNIGYRDRGPRRRHRTPGLKHVASILLHFHDTAVLAPAAHACSHRIRAVIKTANRLSDICGRRSAVPARPTKYEPSAAGSPTPSLAP